MALRRLADKLERGAVRAALAQGWSWSQIAEALGVSRQAVHKRLASLLFPNRCMKGPGMLRTIRQRWRDMRTSKPLCREAEKFANGDGQKESGAEQFVLSALALPDGTARKAFLRIQADPDAFRAAIARQYEEALHNVGVALPAGAMVTADRLLPSGPIYQPSSPRRKRSCERSSTTSR
jgi:hypothetical protein